MQEKGLKEYRENALYTQKQLGEALGYHGRNAEISIQRFEYGLRPIPVRHMRKIHELTGMPYEKMIP